MDIKTYFKNKAEFTRYCNKLGCYECPLHIMNNNKHVSCSTLEFDYPEVAVDIVQKYIKEKEDFIFCLKTLKKQSYKKCNAYESCTECELSKNNGLN